MLSLLFKHKPDLNVDDNVDFSFSEYMKTIHGFEKVKLADLKSELLGVNNQALKV